MSAVPLAGLSAAGGWRYDDAARADKLVASLRRHGQLRPLVIGTLPDGTRQVVDGRRLLAAMLALGWTEALAIDVGPLDGPAAAVQLALALECGFEIDYARLALAVADLLSAGVTATELSMRSPFTAERIGYLGKLARFDWSQFDEATDRSPMLEWATDADEAAAQEPDPVVAVPAEVTAAELAREAEAVAPDAPAEVVAANIREHRRRNARPGQMLLDLK